MQHPASRREVQECNSGRMKSDIDFLVSNGYMTRSDEDLVTSKLPSSSHRNPQLASPPSSVASTPAASSFERLPSFRKNPPPPSAAPPKQQARAIWGYNENNSVCRLATWRYGRDADGSLQRILQISRSMRARSSKSLKRSTMTGTRVVWRAEKACYPHRMLRR